MEIKQIHVENIRGFVSTSFDLNRQNVIFVGANNTGKTSILILLNWLFNEVTEGHLRQSIPMPESWRSILIPARETRNQARRIVLKVELSDGRKRRKYCGDSPKEWCVRLRFDIRLTPAARIVARLSVPSRSEPFESESKALDFLRELQHTYHFLYVSPFRGHSHDRVSAMLERLYQERLLDWKGSLGPNSNDSKELRKITRKLEEFSRKVLDPKIESITGTLPKGMRPKTQLAPGIDIDLLVSLLASNAELKLSNGAHDESYVDLSKVGSGLRSLFELSICLNFDENKRVILAIEEPEAFLHPLAQRTLAKQLYKQGAYKRLISTHSPIFVEESEFKDVVLVKDHQFYPSHLSDQRQKEESWALLKKHGAELLFAKSVLLVEGESDYFFFEVLRERLQEVDIEGLLNGLYVLPVGGKDSFYPYVNLIESFKNKVAPIPWLIAVDADAQSSVAKTIRQIGREVPLEVDAQLQTMTGHFAGGRATDWIAATHGLNQLFEKYELPIFFMSADLEYSSLEIASVELLTGLRSLMNQDEGRTKEELLKSLGSKGIDCRKIADPKKMPYIRTFIAKNLTGAECGGAIIALLRKWAAPMGLKTKDLDALINQLA